MESSSIMSHVRTISGLYHETGSLTFASLGSSASSQNCWYPVGCCHKNLICWCHLRMSWNLMFSLSEGVCVCVCVWTCAPIERDTNQSCCECFCQLSQSKNIRNNTMKVFISFCCQIKLQITHLQHRRPAESGWDRYLSSLWYSHSLLLCAGTRLCSLCAFILYVRMQPSWSTAALQEKQPLL